MEENNQENKPKTIETPSLKSGDKIIQREIEEEMKSSYLAYSMSVIVGRALPDVRDGLKPVHRRILFAMNDMGMTHDKPFKKSARIVGECFVKDTLVLTDNGLLPIQDVQREDKVFTQKGLEKVTQLYIMPKRKLLKISLENGSENISTTSQRFKVLNDDLQFIWKDASELQKGDYIVVKSHYPEIEKEIKANGRDLNENIAYLLGQLISDGWVENKGRLFFYSACMPVMKRIENILKIEFNYLPTIEEIEYEYETDNGLMLLNKGFQVRINKKTINQYFTKTFNLLGVKASTKKIPAQIFQSPKKVIFSFISGLIDGDGSIHKNRNVIHYGTVSQELSKQLIILLQHLGIYGVRYPEQPAKERLVNGRFIKGNYTFFNLEFRGENSHQLGANLNLAEDEKSRKLRELLYNDLGKASHDILPFGAKKIFEELSKHHLGGGWYADSSGAKFRAGVKHPSGVKIRYCKGLHDKPLRISQILEWGIKEKLRKIGSDLYEFIKEVIDNKIFFIEVADVKECGEEVTYDLQIENTHEFIANGMIVHNCLGKYHPHGDMAVYDSMVRMVQPFSLRYPLVQGQGNFGSVDGDSAAAMRYTEARLNKLSEEILQDIEKRTVKFTPNFDASLEEPTVLPAKVPNLLINGSSGIAVGMATNIPPHNLKEIADGIISTINNPEISVEQLMQHVKGPDFPTGAIICGRQGIKQVYATGKGKILVRSKIGVEKDSILISEIPYMVNKAELITQMADLVRDKKIIGISDIRDESDREGMRIVIELRKDANSDVVINQLCKHTRVQTTFGIIMLALVNNEPKILTLKQLIQHYISHRKSIVRKRTLFDLNKAQDRAHILEGLLIALKDVDLTVKLIKESQSVEQARESLITTLEITEEQSKAILDMKLQRLAALEQEKIKQEHSELLKLIEELKAILASEQKILEIIKKELEELKQSYGDERRTEITDEEIESLEIEDLIKQEKMVITITHSGYIKRQPLAFYRQQKRGGKGIIAAGTKEQDFVEDIFIADTHSYILFFTNKGKIHWLKVYNVPESSRQAMGKALVNLLQLEKDESISAFVPVAEFKENEFLVMATRKGTVKKTELMAYSNPRRGGIIAITLDPDDELISVVKTDGAGQIMLATKNGLAVRFKETDVRPTGRSAKGVRGATLRDKDEVIGMVVADDTKTLLTITENGYGKRTNVGEYRLTRRGGVGVRNIICSERNGNVVAIKSITDKDEIMFISKGGITIRTPAKGISVIGRATQGMTLMKLEQGDHIVAAAKIIKEEHEPEDTNNLNNKEE